MPQSQVTLAPERVEVVVGDAAVQVCVEVVQILGLAGVDVARDVEVVVVGGAGDLVHRHHAGVTGQLGLLVEHVHDLVDVLRAQAVLVAVLEETLARVDHEDAGTGVGVLLVDD